MECADHECVRKCVCVCVGVIVCPVAARASQHLCLRATKSIASYRDGASKEGALRPLKEMLKVHVYSRSVHARRMHTDRQTDAYVRTHTLANDSELGQGSLRGSVGCCLHRSVVTSCFFVH